MMKPNVCCCEHLVLMLELLCQKDNFPPVIYHDGGKVALLDIYG